MKYPKNKCQLFMAILSEVVYDIKHDIVRVSKLFKEYVGGGQYENKEDVKRYKVELKSDRMLLHPLD